LWKSFCVQEISVDDRLQRQFMDEPSVSSQRVTQLLALWSHGDDAALRELTPLVYEELRRLAHHFMEGQRPEHTLQTTALVNEAYLRLADQTSPNFTNRSHFFAVAFTTQPPPKRRANQMAFSRSRVQESPSIRLLPSTPR